MEKRDRFQKEGRRRENETRDEEYIEDSEMRERERPHPRGHDIWRGRDGPGPQLRWVSCQGPCPAASEEDLLHLDQLLQRTAQKPRNLSWGS